MKVTALTKFRLAEERQRRDLLAKGYEEIGERGGKLWELHRGYRIGYRITDVVIAVDGRTLFAKIEDQVNSAAA